MDAFENGLRNSQGNITSLEARASFSNDKHAGLIFEKLTNLIGTQVPHFGDFRNGVVPLDVRRGLDLCSFGHRRKNLPDRLKNIQRPRAGEGLDRLRLRMYRVKYVSIRYATLTSSLPG